MNSQKISGFGLVLCSAILSFGGVAIVGWTSIDCTFGGRGGDIAVAMTLAAFFLRKDLDLVIRTAISKTGPSIEKDLEDFQKPHQKNPSVEPINVLDQRITAIEVARTISMNSQKKMDRYFAGAAVIGTLVGGFGDLLACFIK